MIHGLLLGAILIASAQLNKTDCGRDELIGPVQSVVTTFQSLKKQQDGSIDRLQRPVSRDSYDRFCNLIDHQEDSVDFVRDEHPQRIDASTIILHSNMGDQRVSLRFDASGYRIESWTTVAENGSFIAHYTYTNDASGRTVRIDSFGPDGKVSGFTAFVRDDSENVVREDFHFGNPPDLTETFTYEFDGHGNWIKKFVSGNDPENGVTTIQPIGIQFRAITYYS